MLRDEIFNSRFEQTIFRWYRRFFSIEEIESSEVLQWVFGALLFALFVTFNRWVAESTVTTTAYLNNDYTCWPYFLNCGKYYFLTALPYGYSQTIFYSALFGLMLLIVYFMYKRDWVLAHMGLLLLFLWKFFVVFVLTYKATGNYDYYDIVLLFISLFLPHKLFFLRVGFVGLYFLASTIKFDDGWILGTYFTSLATGLPIFGDAITPLATNFVIFMQVVGAWLLLSENKLLQRLAFTYFVLFHLYSGILVQYRYLATALPMLIILFGLFNHERVPVPRTRRSIFGWILLSCLLFTQLLPLAIFGAQKMTMEGDKYRLYMFEANHQCVSRVSIYDKKGKVRITRDESPNAHNRCDPYRVWFRLQQQCMRGENVIDRIAWQYDHSINGGPFYRIVDVENVCSLQYYPLSRNTWIKTIEDSPPLIGYPVKNLYD